MIKFLNLLYELKILESLSTGDKQILDNILGQDLEEAVEFNKTFLKVKSYLSKGLLTASIVAAILASPKLSQGQKQSIKSIKGIETLLKGGESKSSSTAFIPFGDMADNMKEEGWTPIEQSMDSHEATYFNKYNKAFNIVVINGKSSGFLAIKAKRNGKFDLFIRDRDGKMKDFYIYHDMDLPRIHDFTVNHKSTIQQRVDDLKKDGSTNIAYNKFNENEVDTKSIQ